MATPSSPGRGSWPVESAGPKYQPCPSQRKLTGRELNSEATKPKATVTKIQNNPSFHALTVDGCVTTHASSESATNDAVASMAARQMPKRRIETWNDAGARMGETTLARQTRLNTSVPLVPPKPKLFFTA